MMLRVAKIAALTVPLLLAGCETVQEIKSFKLSDIDMGFLWRHKSDDAAPVKTAEVAQPAPTEVEGLQRDDLRAPFGAEPVAVASRDGL
jgi:hypothetical protein